MTKRPADQLSKERRTALLSPSTFAPEIVQEQWWTVLSGEEGPFEWSFSWLTPMRIMHILTDRTDYCFGLRSVRTGGFENLVSETPNTVLSHLKHWSTAIARQAITIKGYVYKENCGPIVLVFEGAAVR